jgi:hypothetical protein
MIEDDGDIVRGLGFVVMNSAHLEGWIHELLFHLASIEEYTEKEQRWPISRKIKKIKGILSKTDDPLAVEICDNLDLCSEHFEWRNELVHGRIYAPECHEDNLHSSRPNVPNRKADSKELYMLANNLNELSVRVYRPFIFDLPRLIEKIKQEDV